MKIVTGKSFNPTLIFAVLALVALVVNCVVNYPYRPFPTDELWSYSIPLKGGDWLADADDVLLNSPVHIYTLIAVKQVVTLLQIEWFQTFLVTVALCLSGAAFLLGMMIQAVTGRLLFSLGAMVLFIVSAWSQTYLHFYTYGPVAVLFMMTSLYCFTRFYLKGTGISWGVAAGLFAGLFFLSSSSAKLMACLLLGAYTLLMVTSTITGKYRQCLGMLSAAAVPIIGFMPMYLNPLLDHLKANVECNHAIVCHMRYGLIPKTPFFSFFYLLSVYSPPLLVFLLVSLAIAVIKGRSLVRIGREGILVLTFMALILLHTVILDLLPFTKLGRSQFVLLPLVIMAVTLLYANFPTKKRIGGWIFLGFILVTVPFDISASTETWTVRREAPEELESLPNDTICYVLAEDPHEYFIKDWLGFPDNNSTRLADIPQLVAARTTPVAIIVGPTGPNSGKSILRHSILFDFSYELPSGISEAPHLIKLPYYAHYPFFMMEEENCQFFYFYHQIPQSTDPQSQLTVYYWPAKAR